MRKKEQQMKTSNRKILSSLLIGCLFLGGFCLSNNAFADDEQSANEEIVDLMLAYLAWVDECDIELTGGDASAKGRIQFKKKRRGGYWKMGISGVYSEKGTTDFRWIDTSVMSGSTTLLSWGRCEVGIGAILGTSEEGELSNDLGAVAFSGQLNYTIPEHIAIIPIEVSGRITYSPESLSFWDMDNYLGLQFGIDVPIAKTTSILLQYNLYDIDIEATSTDPDSDVFQFGLAFHF